MGCRAEGPSAAPAATVRCVITGALRDRINTRADRWVGSAREAPGRYSPTSIGSVSGSSGKPT
jgi:hypothetical protein